MPDFERTTTVTAAPDDAFRYLSDAGNLPRYVATMTLAEPKEGDRLRVAADVQGRHEEGDALVRVDPSQRRMEWSGAGESPYRGWLEVSRSGDATSVSVHIHSEREEDGSEINRALDETVANIERLLGTG